MFSSLSACLSVSNFAQKRATDLHEIFTEGWQSANENEQIIKFWWRSGSPSGYRDRARQIYKNISMLFLFPVTTDLLLSGRLVYTAHKRPCTTWPYTAVTVVYTAIYTVVHKPCTRYYVYAAVYMAHTGRCYGSLHSPRTHPHVYTAVYTVIYGPCKMAVYTTVYTVRTRAHGP